MRTDPNTCTGMSITSNGNLRVLVPTYTQPGGGGCISDMSICEKTQNRVNLGLKRRIFMSKLICLCAFMFLGMLHSQQRAYVMVWRNSPSVASTGRIFRRSKIVTFVTTASRHNGHRRCLIKTCRNDRKCDRK